jgi:hypothetical protein
LGHVDEPPFDQRLHLPEEEGEQQGADVGPVDVGVGQDDDLVVADLGDVEVLGQPAPMAEMRAWISVFFSILSMRARSTLRIFPRMGRMAWVWGLRASLADPPAELPSTMNSSLSRGVP